MKTFTITILFTLWATVAFAQQKIQYQICGHNFSPLSMRHNLPKNAVYRDTSASAAARAHDVIQRLTFSEN